MRYYKTSYGYVATIKEIEGTEITEAEFNAHLPKCDELAEAKEKKVAEIDVYDTSSSVNGFKYQGQQMWLDKATRVGLVNAVESAILIGREDITFGIGNTSVTMPCENAKQMLAQLEMYALECYNVTLKHKTEVEALTSVEEVNAYDITEGYPEMLEF